MKLFQNISISLTFIVFIGILFLNQQFAFIDDLSYKENKATASKPELFNMPTEKYPTLYDAWYNDHFSLRGHFLKHTGWIFTQLFKQSPKPEKVIIGKNKWLFNVVKELDCYYGNRNFSTEQLKIVTDELRYRKQVLDSMNIQMLLVIAPSKFTVYPEYLPHILKQENTFNSGTQLYKALKAETNIEVIYAKDILIPVKDSVQVFFKSDNHWNDFAGIAVAREIIRHTKTPMPYPNADQFIWDTVYYANGNLSNMLGDNTHFTENKIQYRLHPNDAQSSVSYRYKSFAETYTTPSNNCKTFVSNNTNGLNALIIRDSFTNAMMPYLVKSFHHSTYVKDNWSYRFNRDIIEIEKPDVVIFEVLESLIPNIYNKGLSEFTIQKYNLNKSDS